jgi:hypothetical protein
LKERPVSTRGFVGFVRNGATLATYCHADGDPAILGLQTAIFAVDNHPQIADLADDFFALERVGPDVKVDRTGAIGAYLRAGRVPVLFDVPLQDALATLPPDLEWGYLINVDTGQFEAHRMPGNSGVPVETFAIDLEQLDIDELELLIYAGTGAHDDARDAGEAAHLQHVLKKEFGIDLPPS